MNGDRNLEVKRGSNCELLLLKVILMVSEPPEGLGKVLKEEYRVPVGAVRQRD